MCYAKEYVDELSLLYEKIDKKWDDLFKDLSNIDLKLEDVYHYIENTKFNASKGYKYAFKIKQLRQERRKIKNEIGTMQVLKALLRDNKNISNISNRIIKCNSNQKNRTYTNKILKAI